MPIHAEPFHPSDTPADGLAGHLLLAEYIHRSANDFAAACAEVHLAGRQATLERTRDRLETLSQRLYALAAIQRLLQPPRRGLMDLGAALATLCQLHTQARFTELGVFVELRALDVMVDAPRGWALLTIVSELMTNAARHAFRAVGGLVRVEVRGCGEDIVCIVSDDGVGFAANSAQPGCGGAIVAQLARDAGIALRARNCLVGTSVELRLAPAACH